MSASCTVDIVGSDQKSGKTNNGFSRDFVEQAKFWVHNVPNGLNGFKVTNDIGP